MKRRNFLKKSTVVAGLTGFQTSTLLFTIACGRPQKPLRIHRPAGLANEEIHSSEYLRRVRTEKYLTKIPAFAESKLTPEVRILPMPLAERLKRNVVRRMGFAV